MNYIFHNPQAGTKSREAVSQMLSSLYNVGNSLVVDMTNTEYCQSIIAQMGSEDSLIIAGGDGTLNRFVNDHRGQKLPENILYLPTGTGNDFAKDKGLDGAKGPFRITEDLKRLPTVTVNGKESLFINGVGFGIDGYCCEEGDRERAKGEKNVNYTSIAIKGMLFHFRPRDAKITADGREYTFKKVWIAPTMNGRCYGGGMYPTPSQDRSNNSTLSLLVFHGSGKLRTLMIFPSIFKGEHVKEKKYVEIIKAREITVEFSEPTPLQIDGETVSGVRKYTAKAPV